ncbi:hypothetical protein L1987_53406 [Smallanthus sonchifolius]|uniref:Uncharacterized protein n=1 Tax=Smallanthus sonchifolius TaxID=185202 RepID=A0ACB9EW67_9ASTR|nr:hypothetical protein L1987_53406 [Smallanthus sonchifolius]
MPRKKDPPPSALSPHRSTKGIFKSTSLIDEEEAETRLGSTVGLGDSQEGCARSPPPPILVPIVDVCDTNKEVSLIPSVSVSLDDSEQVGEASRKEESLKNYATGKPGFTGNYAGMADSESSGSLGVQLLRLSYGSSSSEFKAMLTRDYPRTRKVFSPRAPVSGNASMSRGLWDGVVQHHTVLDGERVSQFSDGREQPLAVHVPKEGLEPDSAGGGELPMQPPERVEVVQDVGVGITVDSAMDGAGLDVHKPAEKGNKGSKRTIQA